MLGSSAARAEVPRSMVGAYSEIENIGEHPRLPDVTNFVRAEMISSKTSLSYTFAPQVTSDIKLKVAQAFQQVVAGMNYRILFVVVSADNKDLGAFTATVYDQFGNLSLTRWGKEVDIDKAEALLRKEEQGVYQLTNSDFLN